MVKVLWIGFSKISTGEVTYAMNLIDSLDKTIDNVLIVNEVHVNMLENFKGSFRFHSITDLAFDSFLSELKGLIDVFEIIIFIDLNAFFLEKSITKSKQDMFFSMMEVINKHSNKKIAAIDYLNSFVDTELEYNERTSTALRSLKVKTSGLTVSNKLNWYVTRILPLILSCQLILIPSYISVFTPIPLNKLRNNRICFYNKFTVNDVKHKQVNKRKTVLFVLSKFFINRISVKVLSCLCNNIFKELSKQIDVNQIICIDPIGCVKGGFNNEINIVSRTYIPKEELLLILENTLFVGSFVPSATVGTMAINLGVPFVCFIASESTEKSVYFKDLVKSEFPGFNSLGWWEDELFFSYLTLNNNYFTVVHFLDLCQKDAFTELKEKLYNLSIENNISDYNKNEELLKLPSFNYVLNKWVSGGEFK